MADTEFDLSRRSFIDRVLKASAAVGMASAAPWAGAIAAEPGRERIRLGVIGTGDRGRALIQNILKTKNCTIAAICDDYQPYLDKARALLPAGTPTYSDHRAMLDAKGLDAVVIATPLNLHARHAFDSFDAGLHVWCEKAMARTTGDCTKMVERSRASGRILQIGHQRLFNPTYLNALARAKAGEIGTITQIRASWHRNRDWRRAVPPGSGLERKLNWRLYRESSAGLMTELCTHQIQVGNWFMDALPTRVMGSGSICFWKDGREVYDHVALIYEYPGGRKFIYTSLLNNARYGCEEQIQGHKGTIEPELGRIFKEVPRVPALRQLGTDVQKNRVRTIPIGGATWFPELPITTPGDSLGWSEYDETMLQFEAFGEAVKTGVPVPGLLRQAYHASIASLLGEQAMDERRAIDWPSSLVMSA
ncbi:Gfo/Idh/MocA family oxidoreductase [Sphingomonas sp. SUN019]|uniref:Gfo/Idh/MocA family protein n=1 Tax=Sphingomonas sp. SUN019 TaxID=2937788 RepID=UPI00216480C7|nr:Gfo/Idh/MocA family oxidoreductase [Sphingomonas sp. SUN019]UVO49692.1 Gfo/Idh/MocA family oxidoreductase [Sphingomonas sp. SUN019]